MTSIQEQALYQLGYLEELHFGMLNYASTQFPSRFKYPTNYVGENDK